MSRNPSSFPPPRSGGSPLRSDKRRVLPPSSKQGKTSPPAYSQESETEATTISEDVPPKSIANMRDSLRNMIETMGNKGCECPNKTAVPECNNTATDVTSSTEESGERCQCCGKQTTSESGGDCCSCNVTQQQRPYPCVGRVGRSPQYERMHQHCSMEGEQQGEKRFIRPIMNMSSEECPCEETCPGKQNTREKLKHFFNKVVGIKENIQSQHELYKFRMKQEDPNFKLPKTLIFDLVDGIPKPEPQPQPAEKPKQTIEKRDRTDFGNKIDVYYFDHGNSGYYRTTDNPPPLLADFFIEQTDAYATRFWAEIFGTIHIGVAFVTTFLIQFVRFFLYSFLRPLTVGLVQLCSDYFFKPLLSSTFNGIIQPTIILFYNIATSFRDLCEPLAQGIGYFTREIAVIFQAVRLVEVNKYKSMQSPRCIGNV